MKKRGPNKIVSPYNMRDIYNDYIKDKDKESPYYVSFQQFLEITGVYYKELSRELIYESRTINLPFRMGTVTVMKKRPRIFNSSNLSIDWKETKEFGKYIHHINDHTGGYKFRFFWNKQKCMMVNRELYRMVFSRTNKRSLAKEIKSGRDYLEIKGRN